VYQGSVWEYDAKPLNFCPFPASQQCPVAPPPPPPPPVVVVEEPCPVVVEEPCPPPIVETPPPKPCYVIETPREPECPKVEPPCEVKKPEEAPCAPPPPPCPELPPKCGSLSSQVAPTCAQLCPCQNQEKTCPSPKADPDDPIAKLVCGCGACSKLRGCSPEEMFIPEYKPMVRGACPYCGTAQRGDTEGCFICQLTRSIRDPCYQEPCESPPPKKEPCAPKPPCPTNEDKCHSDKFDMKKDGSPTYEGGMCFQRALKFLSLANPRKNALEDVALDGQQVDSFSNSNSDSNDCNEGDKKKKYDGGMSLDDAKEYIWKGGK